MKCAKCGQAEDKVIDSRTSKDGFSIRRRRECLNCSYRFTTYEQLEQTTLLIAKRSGIREPFDRGKLLQGFFKACEKRPVGLHVIEQAVDEIIGELRAEGLREVPTNTIGAMVMNKLRGIDHVAYVRFASVYREFEDVGEFIDEIQSLGGKETKKDQPPPLSRDIHQSDLF